MMRTLFGMILAMVLAMGSAVALAGLEEGISAYKSENYSSALAELTPLAAAGNPVAQYLMGEMYAGGKGVQQHDRQAMAWYLRAAEQGNADAQLKLGQMYSDGKGVKRESHHALKWYLKAAAQGKTEAQLRLGLMYFNGEGAPVDLVQSYKWLSIASAKGGEQALKLKSQVEGKMSRAQIEKAQAQMREPKARK